MHPSTLICALAVLNWGVFSVAAVLAPSLNAGRDVVLPRQYRNKDWASKPSGNKEYKNAAVGHGAGKK